MRVAVLCASDWRSRSAVVDALHDALGDTHTSQVIIERRSSSAEVAIIDDLARTWGFAVAEHVADAPADVTLLFGPRTDSVLSSAESIARSKSGHVAWVTAA